MRFAIITEGNIDSLLVKSFGYSKKQIYNVAGIGKVRNFLIKNHEKFDKLIAIVDQDGSTTLTKVFKDIIIPSPFTEEDHYTVYGFKNIKNAYLIILCCPEIEDWIAQSLVQINKSLKDYGYKNIKTFKTNSKTLSVAQDKKILNIIEDLKATNNYKLLNSRIKTLLASG